MISFPEMSINCNVFKEVSMELGKLMEIRLAKPHDSAGIAELEKQCFDDSWCDRDILSYICSETSMCYVAIRDGILAGYMLGRKILPEGEIYRIAVKEELRCRGIGYRLLTHALDEEGNLGVETVFLEVREKNTVARGLYLSAGFEEISVRKNYYKNPDDNAIIMIKGVKCK